MKWRVWITSYEGSYSIVEARDSREAMAKGAFEQRASHTGETVEINAVPEIENTTLHHRKLVRINAQGMVWFQ